MSNKPRPWKLLPLPLPKDFDPSINNPDYFYINFIKPLIPDIIKLMNTGIKIDNNAVENLKNTINTVLLSVKQRINNNHLIKQYEEYIYPQLVQQYKDKVLASTRDYTYYLKDYDNKNIVHRTWVVNTYLKELDLTDNIKDKWSIAELKKLNSNLNKPFLNQIINNKVKLTNTFVQLGMLHLAKYKCSLWNKVREDKAKIPVEIPEFNPASNKQLQQFFKMLDIEPISVSKTTGDPSWNRENIEILYKTTNDNNLLEVLEALIDHSFSAIIKNNFLEAFDSFTVDNTLYGNIKLFGTKTFRPTSNSPNLLNMPSSKSIYAKPLKRCFIAPNNRVIYAIDLSALEDRGIANLSGDKNKQDIFLNKLDSHSLNACVYYKEKIEEILGKNTNNVEYVKNFYKHTETNQILDKIRFDSKAPTFKLVYGGYPDSHKGGVITEELFNKYHNELYPSITDYRENYVLPFAQEHGYIHLGLGCRMYCNDPSNEIRTLNNATAQFWSILTLIAINELNYRIKENNLINFIDVVSTIYDSLYISVDNDSKIIKWLNDNTVEILCVDYLENQIVPNEAIGSIGLNFADLHKISNNASIKEITDVIGNLNGNKN